MYSDESDNKSVLHVKSKYNPYKNSWTLPEGFVLENENLEQAIERNLSEETGGKINCFEQPKLELEKFSF